MLRSVSDRTRPKLLVFVNCSVSVGIRTCGELRKRALVCTFLRTPVLLLQKLSQNSNFPVANQFQSDSLRESTETPRSKPSRMEIKEIVNLAQAGDREAFATLVERYQRVATTRAWTVVGDFHLAQDVAQDAFVIAFHKLASLNDVETFGPWLLEVVRREAIRKSKRKLRQNETLVSNEIVFENQTDPDNQRDDWQHRHEQTLNSIAKLPEHEQEVVVLHYLDGVSTKEIAHLLGRPIGTVTKQLSRAIEANENDADGGFP